MRSKDFISALADKSGNTFANTQQMLQIIVQSLTSKFEAGENVSITGFGSFEIKKRSERVIVNPVTNSKMLVPPKLVLSFKAAKNTKTKLNSEVK